MFEPIQSRACHSEHAQTRSRFITSMRCFSYPVTISFCLGTEKRQDSVKEEKMKNFLTLCVLSLAGAVLLCSAQEEQDISVRWDPRSKIFAVRVEFLLGM